MNGRLDKSMGIVTLIPEAFTKIKPTDHLIFSKRHHGRNETTQILQVILHLKYQPRGAHAKKSDGQRHAKKSDGQSHHTRDPKYHSLRTRGRKISQTGNSVFIYN